MANFRVVVALGVLAFVVLALFFYMQPKNVVTIGTVSVKVEIVDSQVERIQGLSGRESLGDGEGMLFMFENEDNWGIWMKDMRFAIDIIWADSSGTVISIERDVAPSTYPQAFYPARPRALYVLEVPAGFVTKHGIAEGMILQQN